MTDKRLIEVDFPLEAVSLDSVHEKNVRHGHISTLHIWPARRPLAASRAALIATLLPDPGDKTSRDALKQRLAGYVEEKLQKKDGEETLKKETVGGILHWGREQGPDLDWFRQEIRKAYGGRAPRVLDPFAGGGAIPLEALRLGCEVTAADLNPVAWFILKCTLEYPQRLAGQKRRLPDFALADRSFMADYLKARGMKPKAIVAALKAPGEGAALNENHELFAIPGIDPTLLEADLAWHVRAWGRWVLGEARKELAAFYPTYAEFCRLKPYEVVPLARADEDRLKWVPTNAAGEPQVELLNGGYDAVYLSNEANPRWVAKSTVAYLWARTVRCKACRAELPLLKTAWINTKAGKRSRLTMTPNEDRSGVRFAIEHIVKKGDDKQLGAGTMSRTGALCPCCSVVNTMADIRLEGRAGRLGQVLTTVVVDSPSGKEYRLPTALEIERAESAQEQLAGVYADIPFGLPTEPLAGADALGFRVPLYGFDQWNKLYTPRQLLALGIFVQATRRLSGALTRLGYVDYWREAIRLLLTVALDRTANYLSTLCLWESEAGEVKQTFLRYALPITWDFGEGNPLSSADRYWNGAVNNVALVTERLVSPQFEHLPQATVMHQSATTVLGDFDVVVTDPPYYDAIPYSDLMDFFYVWLRRTLHGLSPEMDAAFAEPLAPKWNHETNDGELIDDAARFGNDKEASKRNYEDGMARAFQACHAVLRPEGRLVIVFAHKQPDAWETLVTAIIRAGFVVDGSWPIVTEMRGGVRNHGRASLSSSIWLVCRKRPAQARAGWDTSVLEEMHQTIPERLRAFWDAGIRGPDFVWAATGPALESYSQYPVVKKFAATSGETMSVDEFLRAVRRIVVDFAVGRILHQDSGDSLGLDDITTYYLLHRKDFGLGDAPAGACILYATSCGVQIGFLTNQIEMLVRGKGSSPAEPGENDEESETEPEASSSGSELRLKVWSQRKHRSLGEDASNGRASPLIDQVHRLMQLWRAGEVHVVNEFLDRRGLRHSPLLPHLLQALIETSRAEKQQDECAILESLSNHIGGLGLPGSGNLF